MLKKYIFIPDASSKLLSMFKLKIDSRGYSQYLAYNIQFLFGFMIHIP